MRIGFDAKRYFHNYSGLGNYSRDLVDTLISRHTEDKFFLFDSNPPHLEFPSNTIAVVPTAASIFWRLRGIRKEIDLHKLDIYHGLSNEIPFGLKYVPVRKIVTIHDVIFKDFPSNALIFLS